MTALLEYRNATKKFGSKIAIDDLSFEVNEGEIFGLLGPNGAGKTTLIRSALGIIPLSSGSVSIFGSEPSIDSLTHVSYLPEERGLYKDAMVIDTMRYFGALRGLSGDDLEARIRKWLIKVGLLDHSTKQMRELSKGMRQKVQIATAFLHDPKLAILDEPFSGLDPINIHLVAQLIRERKESSQTTILSTHMLGRVEEFCERVALISAGKIVELGEVAAMRKRYSNGHYILNFDKEISLPEDLNVTILSRTKAQFDLKKTTLDEILQRLLENEIVPTSMYPDLMSLEDVFIQAVSAAARKPE